MNNPSDPSNYENRADQPLDELMESLKNSGEAAEAGQLMTIMAERDDYKDRYMRLAAEFENYKKRSERERADFLRRANENIIKELLPVLDNLERAIEHGRAPGAQEALLEGVDMIAQELKKLLTRHGLADVVALGQPFNPELHQAVMQQDDDTVPENTVINEMQKGYVFHDRLLRPSMVVVSKRPAPEKGPAAGPEEGVRIKVTTD